ncbi:MAG: PEGA domain-containing protein [Polyangiaceae bacterium]|nr:PEGA domain-containing protein [Polyangiaceae bacterium]
MRLLLVLLFALMLPVHAFAQPADKPQTFESLKRTGDEAMDGLRFEEAVKAYRAAYVLKADAVLLYNIGRANEGLGDYPAALESLERFEKEANADLKKRAQGFEDLLRDVRGRVTVLEDETNVPGARIQLRAKQKVTAPHEAPMRVNAGPAVIEVLADGYHPHREDVTLEGGKATKIVAKLKPKDTTGTLRITASMPGATVLVDGKRVGAAPAEAKLKPGPHRVVVEHPRADPVETSAVVTAGKRNEVNVDLVEIVPVHETWWFWTTLGAVAVTAGVTITAVALTEREPSKGTITPGLLRTELFRF